MVQRAFGVLACLAFAASFSGCSTFSPEESKAPETAPEKAQADAGSAAKPSSDAHPAEAPKVDTVLASADKAVADKMDEVAAALAARVAAKQSRSDLDGALADLDRILEIQPSNAVAHLVRGQIKLTRGNPAAASADYSRAVDILSGTAPDHVSGTDSLAQALAALFPGMVQNMQANAYYLRGAARQAGGDTDGALADFNQAVSAAPDFAAVYNNRGVIKGMIQRDADGALADFNKAAELQSKAPDTYANRGNIKLALGQIDEALKDYDQAVALSPSWPAAYFDRAFGKQQKGDLDGAITDLTKAIELKSDYLDAYYNRAVDYDRKQQFGEAIADYDRVIIMNPNAADAFAGRGMDKYRRNDIDGSVSDFNRAIALRKDSVRLYIDRAVANVIKGDSAAAISDFDQVLKLADDETSAYPRLFRCVALLQARRGDPRKELTAAIAKWKDGWPKTIGQFLTGDLTESQLLAEAEKADPKVVAAHRCDAFYFAGIAHLLNGETPAARSFFNECVAVNRPDLFAFRFAQGELDRMKPAP